jgi:hypothetical protein
MEDSVKLTDTQLRLLAAASQRDDGALKRPPHVRKGLELCDWATSTGIRNAVTLCDHAIDRRRSLGAGAAQVDQNRLRKAA